MELSFMISLGLILLIAFSTIPKRLHRREIAVVWMGYAFVFTILFGIGGEGNGGFYKIKEELPRYLSHRLWEVLVMPLLILLYLNSAVAMKRNGAKLAAAAACLLVLWGLEYVVVHLQIFQYVTWRFYWSPLVWLVMMLLAIGLQKGMRHFLRKEGVML